MRHPVIHAAATRKTAECVVVGLSSTEEGVVSYGEIQARPYVTGESVKGVVEVTGPRLARRLMAQQFETSEDVKSWIAVEIDSAGRNLATFAGFELALLDLAGACFGEDLEPTTVPWAPPVPGRVIGFDVPTDQLLRHCALLKMTGCRHLKVKVGLPDDRTRLELITSSFAPDMKIRIDANAAWSASEAVARLRQLEHFDLEHVEQPVAAGDVDGLRRVRKETRFAVMADESVCTFNEGRRLIEAEAVDAFNIRLAKCGGYYGSTRLVRLARDAGIDTRLGTMVGETSILGRAALVFAREIGGFDYIEGLGQSGFLLEKDLRKTSDKFDHLAKGAGAVCRKTLKSLSAATPRIFRE